MAGAIVALLLLSVPGAGQAPLFLVDAETEVASVGFRFPDSRSLEESELRRQIALTSPGIGYRLRSTLDFLPLVDPSRRQLFSPPSLLRDVKRLERHYRDAGFRGTEVGYEVALDTARNAVAVTLVVREGRPVVLDTLAVVTPTGAPLGPTLPEELRLPWTGLEAELAGRRGSRLSRTLRLQIESRIADWLRDRGYPWASATADTTALEGRTPLVVTVDPGPRTRVGSLVFEGHRRLAEPVLRREVPLGPGDWYSRSRLAEGQRQLFGLDMVRLATVETRPDTAGPDRVDLRIRVTEGDLRLVSGQVGYGIASGLSATAAWSHRDFLGGARTFEASVLANTGFLAPEASVARRYGLSLTLRQPWLLSRYVEGVLRPFVEYRDDLRDESVQWGAEASALFGRGRTRSVVVQYGLTSRRVLDAGVATPLGTAGNLPELLAGLDTLNLDRRTSSLRAVARWARSPATGPGLRRDWSVLASVEVAGPAGLSTVQYGKLVGGLTGELPLAPGVSARGRVEAGRVLPFGASTPAPDGSDRLERYLELRDATLTAGGAQDVRGWGSELLGPKLPDLRADGADRIAANRYVPLGGLARWTASVQVGVPLPFLGRPHDLHGFLDAGRIWTPDDRFLPTAEPLLADQLDDEVRFGAGLGLAFSTPVGPVQLDVGYKLNPSLLDVRDPAAVGRALLEDRPLESVPAEPIRRWHLHISLGGVS